MSCTVIAVPILLYQAIGAVVASAAISATIKASENNSDKKDTFCEEVHVINAKHFIEKSFETVFMDKDTLVKTLEEHGVTNISSDDSIIRGQVDSYTLNFEKHSDDKPYYLRVTCLDSDNAEEKLNDLSSEYALNVQEEAYLSIIEKLKDNKMEVEEEEVLDDNTIVLTVNID